ncbi:prion-inhibition and propagation-domain-containing protein [Colletotrichum cereale]|nr:prion-inhibition and propagation-domain-containing protein [Colletotrichum cereale]
METAAAAVAFITIAVNSFQACVQAFEFFNTAQHIGPDGDFFRTGLEFEKYRLIAWARRVGIHQENKRSALNWTLASLLLEQLRLFLTSAEGLKSRYSLDVSEEEIQESEKLRALDPPKHGVSKLIARLKPTVYTTSAQIIQANNAPIKRLLWATRDKEKLKRIVGEISELIDKLEFLLDDDERLSERTRYAKLLREVVSLTSTAAEAGQVGDLIGDGSHLSHDKLAIKAAVHVKQIRLVVGIDKRNDEVKPTTSKEIMGLRIEDLKVLRRSLKPWDKEPLRYEGLEFASYKSKQVLIQWKIAEGNEWEMYQGQMKCLAMLLGSIHDNSFRSLPCMGYYPLQIHGRHGVVYEVPVTETSCTFRSLKDLMLDQVHVSLGRRFEISKALAETVLQLHTAGWMHKSLRPENIIFLAPQGSDDSAFLKTEPILVGYDYARADDEGAAAAYTQLPDTELEADLYRHPQARGRNRERYQKRFDLYSLGCILLELGCWLRLRDIFSEHSNGELADRIAKAAENNEVFELPTVNELLEKDTASAFLEHHAGEKFKDTVLLCCSVKKAGETTEGLLREQLEVIQTLDWCRV